MKPKSELQTELADKLSQCADLLCKVAEEGVEGLNFDEGKKVINLNALRGLYANPR
jgi:hypothetical protein